MNGERPVEDLLRALAPRVLGVLTRRHGDFAAAEDAVQEAMIAAVAHWTRDGIPERPRGWLIQAATRKYIDRARGDAARRRREELAASLEPPPGEDTGWDDSLLVLFMCCHPTLTRASSIALTLRAVGGLTTGEIARAFLVPEETMGRRISRAKQRVKDSGVPFTRPGPEEWPARLRSVLHVLYLIYTEGHTAGGGAGLHRTDLSDEAIRLARLVHRLLPGDGEAAGLLALMLLTEARRPARTGPGGEFVPLAEQDRTRWDRALITEGTALLDTAITRGGVGEYGIQAAVAALHSRAARAEDTDWPQVLGLYGLLERMTGNPVVTLNRAIAMGMADGPAAGLALLADLGERLGGHPRLHAARAHLLELSGDAEGARAEYRAAAAVATSVPERDHLTARAARLGARER